jgi:hypothetical protein
MCLSTHAFAFDLLRCVDLTKFKIFQTDLKVDLKMAWNLNKKENPFLSFLFRPKAHSSLPLGLLLFLPRAAQLEVSFPLPSRPRPKPAQQGSPPTSARSPSFFLGPEPALSLGLAQQHP